MGGRVMTRKAELRPMATRPALQGDDMPKWFVAHMKQYPVLSTEAERELLERVASGDLEARRLVIEHNYRLVMFVARRYRSRGLEYDDLVQEGIFGLMRAVDRFNGKRGNKFSTYATWWIRQAVSRAVMDQGSTIRLPVYMHGEAKRKQREKLPTAWEPVSLEMNVRSKAKPFHEGSPTSLGDTLTDPVEETDETAAENVDRENAPAQLAALFDLARIVPRDRQILLERARGATLESIATRYDLSRERVRQIVSRCLERLQAAAGVNLSDMLSSSIA